MAYTHTYTGTLDKVTDLKLGNFEHTVTLENAGTFTVNKLNTRAYHFLEEVLIGESVLVAINRGEIKWMKRA